MFCLFFWKWNKNRNKFWDLATFKSFEKPWNVCVVINGNSKMTTREPRGLQWGNRIVLRPRPGGNRGLGGNCTPPPEFGMNTRKKMQRWLFSESAILFSNFPISQKKYSKKTILNLKFKILAHNSIMLWAGVLNFKFRIVFFEYMYFLKNELHFLKISHLYIKWLSISVWPPDF